MKVEQSTYFNRDGSVRTAEISWGGTIGHWFYIRHRNNPHQVLYADDKGRFYYGQSNLSHVVPVVWNLRSECNRVARNQNGRVYKYPYKLKAT